jgi:hypothetical protein
MLPVGAVLIVAAATAAPTWRARARIAAIASLMTAVLALPYVAGLSLQRGHLTTSETGTYNYAIHVQGVTYQHWQGETPGAGRPLHPTLKLLDSPRVFGFDGPLPGTYPYWTDPSYWYEGVQKHVDWPRQMKAVFKQLYYTAGLTYANNTSFLAALFMLFFVALGSPGALRHAARFSIVVGPALIGLLPYLIVHWEKRYLGGFLCIFFVSAIAAAKVPMTPLGRRLYGAVASFAALMFIAPFGPSGTLQMLRVHDAVLQESPPASNQYWQVTEALRRAGFGPGTKVATTDHALMESVMWARVARMKIIAEVYYRADRPETRASNFWNASSADQDRVLDAFRRSGARLAVSSETPKGARASEWKQLASSEFYYRPL